MSTEASPDFAELVLRAVEAIPPGRVMTYGDLAELVGRSGPRQVGQVMARDGAGVAWWRVCRADGGIAPGLAARARRHLTDEGTPLRGDRVDLARARWNPALEDHRSMSGTGL